MEYSKKFAAVRTALKMTQTQLAYKLNASQTIISNYETGKIQVPLRVAHKLIKLAEKKGIKVKVTQLRDI